MKYKSLKIVGYIVLISLAMLISVKAWAIELNDLAPDFTLRSLAGENIRLQDYRGKVVLVNFLGQLVWSVSAGNANTRSYISTL